MFEKMFQGQKKLEVAREKVEQQVDQEFLRQFKTREKIDFLGTKGIEVADIVPEGAHEVPVLFVPGFGPGPDAYMESIEELYKGKRRVLVFSFPTDIADEKQEFARRDTDLPFGQDIKSEVLRQIVRVKQLDQVDIVAHSEGCMNAIIAAFKEDSHFRNFVLVAPPGITGKESYLHIAGRGKKNAEASKKIQRQGSELEQARLEIKKHDIKRWLKERGVVSGIIESMEPGRFETAAMQAELHQRGHGVSVVAGVDDAMISMSQLQRDNTGTTRSAEDLGIDGFYSVAGGHDKLTTDPNRYGFLVADAVEKLEKKYSTQEV